MKTFDCKYINIQPKKCDTKEKNKGLFKISKKAPKKVIWGGN